MRRQNVRTEGESGDGWRGGEVELDHGPWQTNWKWT